MLSLKLLLYVALLLVPVQCKLYTDPLKLPKTKYDFVIVGAGTAGGVLANRLTEDPAITVLMIEAGISNEDVFATQVPALGPTLSPNTSVTWNYTTTPQSGFDGRTIAYPRGRVLGGSSTINFEVWTRGSQDDWDRFANITGDRGWSWSQMIPYMIKSEQLVPPTDHHNISDEVDPTIHGTKGPVKISPRGFPASIDQRVIQTTRELSDEFPFNLDMNSGHTLGLGWSQATVNTTGRRSNAATAYIHPALARPNLDVLIHTQVTKLLPVSESSAVPVFTQVEIAQNATSRRLHVSAKKEVILSAGAVGTPQILQLSGIGDPKLLRSVGIKPCVNLPNVGQNLADHPFLPNHWFVNSTSTLEILGRNATLFAELLAQWNATGTGLMSDSGANHIIWLRLPNDKVNPDPSAGPNSGHFEILVVNGFNSFIEPTPETGFFLTLVTTVASPVSRGSVTLATSNPFDDPLIDPALLKDPLDVRVMVEAIKTAKKFVTARVWSDYIIGPREALANANTDTELAVYASNFTTTVFHPVGTARMAAVSSDDGVVTPNLLVKGTSNLRIVDASVLPFIPAAHPQAAVYAVAERAADLIKEAWATGGNHGH